MAGWGKSLKGLFVVDEQKGDPVVEGAPTDPEEIERLLASVRTKDNISESPKAPPEVAPPPPPPRASDSNSPIEGKSFTDIYREAGVPPSKYPVEKLIKFLDGIRQMDLNTRKGVVSAMDAADPEWTVEDPVKDAQAKIAALQFAKNNVTQALAAAESKAADDQKAADAYLTDASAKIKQQIEELQSLLQSEVTSVTKQKTEIDSGIRAAREAAVRETTRLEAEVVRLGEVPSMFGPATPPPLPTSRS